MRGRKPALLHLCVEESAGCTLMLLWARELHNPSGMLSLKRPHCLLQRSLGLQVTPSL